MLAACSGACSRGFRDLVVVSMASRFAIIRACTSRASAPMFAKGRWTVYWTLVHWRLPPRACGFLRHAGGRRPLHEAARLERQDQERHAERGMDYSTRVPHV